MMKHMVYKALMNKPLLEKSLLLRVNARDITVENNFAVVGGTPFFLDDMQVGYLAEAIDDLCDFDHFDQVDLLVHLNLDSVYLIESVDVRVAFRSIEGFKRIAKSILFRFNPTDTVEVKVSMDRGEVKGLMILPKISMTIDMDACMSNIFFLTSYLPTQFQSNQQEFFLEVIEGEISGVCSFIGKSEQASLEVVI
ncbi:hypothetical protein ABHN11_21575 [Brevibacillus centrosporus]|jgi:hypothetical protein|uniref:hypothetical protein n=1 Tax=Brevibacillus centrosporus TaxID=54910 RepID=UPI00398720A7